MSDNRTYADKPLWDLMEEAADTLCTASERYYDAGGTETGKMGQKLDEIDWRPSNLRHVAREWRSMDEELQSHIGKLTQFLDSLQLEPTRTRAEKILVWMAENPAPIVHEWVPVPIVLDGHSAAPTDRDLL